MPKIFSVILTIGIAGAWSAYRAANWGLLSLFILIPILAYFFFRYEQGDTDARQLALVATLAALAAAGRIPFAAIPSVQPTTFLVMITGLVFGAESGFVVGATAALASNMFLGQGPWTPWQMLAWGLVGVTGGLLGRYQDKSWAKGLLMVSAFVWGYLFGWFMNLWNWLAFVYPLTWQSFMATNITSFWPDTMHAVSNVLFMRLFGADLVKILRRFDRKFRVIYLDDNVENVGGDSVVRFSKFLIVFFLLATIIAVPLPAAAGDNGAATAQEEAVSFLHGYYRAKDFQGVLDWGAVGLFAAGEDLNSDRWRQGINTPLSWRAQQVKAGNTFNDEKNTDYQRTLLGVLAAGGDPTDFAGHDLVGEIRSTQLKDGKFADTITQGGEYLVNAHVWGIISLLAAGEDIPDKRAALQWLKDRQHADGGFHFDSTVKQSESDMTGLSLVAMALLGEDEDSEKVKKALTYLEEEQLANGGFANWGTENLESTASVVQGLMALGMDPAAPRWTKADGSNPITAIIDYQLADGSFAHIPGGRTDMMATKQALIALSDYLNGDSVYLRLRRLSLLSKFTDINEGHWAYPAVKQLVKDGTLNGYPDGTFKPEKLVTRAEFAKFLVYGLGYAKEAAGKTYKFKDLTASHWANPVVKAAVDKGLIKGKAQDIFAPGDNITGAEVATMLVRALGLEARAQSSSGDYWYSGYIKAAEEEGLLYPGFSPKKDATRAQCAAAVAVLRDKVLE
ncbi:S-layer homology domain-containing protein [Metallumcola ferriviriculae]|uniref:S-layer homology domain-containing protein n=1 Tax=Metallumcola ferriviriculae TaxID=3039180 RepID=A0AAU0US18_9FIRM|nr:S-layer homology domain-containing protein [Desulfitibacteraceae bacterium MK1]